MATLTVFVPKPQHVSYGEAMSRVRMWLDYRKIQTSAFKVAPGGRSGFEISFQSGEDASRFQRDFTWPPPQALSGTVGTGESASAGVADD
jgi:hypothetical protein